MYGLVRNPTVDVYLLTATGLAVDMKPDIIRVRTTKSIRSPFGQFEIVLAPRFKDNKSARDLITHWGARRNFVGVATPKKVKRPEELEMLALDYYTANVRPMDVVLIHFKEGPRAVYPDMIGLVDRVARRVELVEGKPTRMIKITGRDFGKVFVEDSIKFFPDDGVARWKDKYPGFKLPLFYTEIFSRKNDYDSFMFGKDVTAPVKYIFSKHPPFINIKVIKPLNVPGERTDSIETEAVEGVELSTTKDFLGQPGGIEGGAGEGDRYLIADSDMLTEGGMWNYEGNIWNFMGRGAIPPFYEMFGDTYPAGNVEEYMGGRRGLVKWFVHLRRSPFSKDEWGELPIAWDATFDRRDTLAGVDDIPKLDFDNITDPMAWRAHLRSKFLPYHTIYEDEVMQEDVGISDADTKSVFWVLPTLGGQIEEGALWSAIPPEAAGPAECEGVGMNVSHLERFGLRILSKNIPLFPIKLDSKGDPVFADDEIFTWGNNWNTRLREWYEHNNLYEAGRIQIRGRSDLKIGERLWRPGVGRMYYIEGLDTGVDLHAGFSTTVLVTRGQPFNGY